ncbi:hypothetical protein M3Y95_00205700 [Aphelenchoides besseyi]|nr:hypothetical protein M3Y95_00205700 [Aphelenchoides besseyi]
MSWWKAIFLFSYIGRSSAENYLTFHNVHLIKQPYASGCTITENTVVECDGTSRDLTTEDHFALDEYKQLTEKWKESVNAIMDTLNLDDEGKPIQIPDYPTFPQICKMCLPSVPPF